MAAYYRTYCTLSVLYLFSLLTSTASAHGTQHGHSQGDMKMGGEDSKPQDPSHYPPTYFAHSEHVAWIYAHILLAALSSIFVLPLGKFSIHHDAAVGQQYMDVQ